MRRTRVWGRLLGLQRAVVEDVLIGDEDEIVVAVRPSWRERDRCGECRRRSPGFDLGDGRRRWRALDLGSTKAFLEAEAPRVTCRRHGIVVCAVPWARHGSRFTRAFEDQTAWLAVNTSKSAVAELMRIAWRTVGAICERVCDDARQEIDLLDGLRRIGIDEISRVIKPGGRVLLIAYSHPAELEFLRLFVAAMEAVAPEFPGLPDDPPPLEFQIADPDVLRQRLIDAGLKDVCIERTAERPAFATGQEMWDWLYHGNPIAEMVVGDLTGEQQATLRQVLDGMLRERAGGNGQAVLRNAVNIGIGTK